MADGRAYCWGYNGYGQLGNNSTTNSSVPVAVDTSGVLAGKTVTAITAGDIHTCAVADGKAYCWGDNGYGQLGNNSTTALAGAGGGETPPGALAGKTVTAITAGDYHTCAVADGKAYCWGDNGYGQLGNNSTTDSSVPVAVNTSGPLAGKTVTAITAGSYHTCAVADGKAYCWGYNADGQLGNNSTTDSTVPVAVRHLRGAGRQDGHRDQPPALRHTVRGGRRAGVLLGLQRLRAVRRQQHHRLDGAGGGGHVRAAGRQDGHRDQPPGTPHVCGGRRQGVLLGLQRRRAAGQQQHHRLDGAGGGGHLRGAGRQDGHRDHRRGTTIAAVAGRVRCRSHRPRWPGWPGTAKVTVSWTAPADDGGSPVLEYVATAIPGGATCTTSSTSCVVSGLTNGTGYTFTVTARNAIGISTPSAPSAPVTPTAALTPPPPVQPCPGKVTGVKAVVKKGKVKITWKAVPAATSYRVRISKPGGKKYKAWKTTTKRVFKAKVRKGKKYRFQVAAIGAGGRGPVTTIRFKGK